MRFDPDNPYLVLRLSANATATEIRATGQRIAVRARLGAADRPEVTRRIETALEQLSDPVTRFLVGLEAPQIGSAAAERFQADARFAHLYDHSATDLTPAIDQVLQGESTLVAQHARGCFAIAQACTLFQAALDPRTGLQSVRSREFANRAQKLLEAGLRDHRAAMSRPEFWIMQRLRAKQIDDPRLDPAKIQKIQESHPEPLLKRLCKLADFALGDGSVSVAAAIVRPIQAVMGKEPIADRCLGEVYRGLGQRIEAKIKQCEDRAKSLMGPEGAPFERALADFRSQLTADLDLMLELGDLPGTIEERARDAAATFFRGFGVSAGNKATACSTAIAALELARNYAISPQLRSNIDENLNSIREIARSVDGRSDLGPYLRRIEVAQQRDDHRAVLVAVRQLIEALGQGKAGEWTKLAAAAASRVALECVKQGVECANQGQVDRARRHFEEALAIETVPKHRAAIQNLLNQIDGKTKAGCLIPLAFIVGPGLLLAALPTAARSLLSAFGVISP